MDQISQAKFDELIDLDINSMSEEELSFLMARRSYMNAVQKERFAKTIKLHEDGKLFSAKKKVVDEEEEDSEEEEEEAPAPKKRASAKKKVA